MTAAPHRIIDEPDLPICQTCLGNAQAFMNAMMEAWADMDQSDETFCFLVLMLADLIRFEEARATDKMDEEYRRYIGRKLQSIGAAIAGDVQ